MKFSLFSYQFADYGSTVPGEVPAGSVMVDVGNRLCPGIIDHHQLSARDLINGRHFKSTSELVLISVHLFPEKIDTFITHRKPDLDAWVAIWLIQYYREHGKFPPSSGKVIDYVAGLDAGNLNIDRNNLRSPVAVAAAIPFLFAGRPKESQNAGILLRGLELVDYIFSRVSEFPEELQSLDLPWFIGADSGFEEEIKFVHRDLDLYEQDLNDPGYTEKTKLLLRNKSNRSTEYVDALFWNQAPRCSLHKHWARSDDRAPQGNGYVLTFIPQKGDCGVKGFGDHLYNRAIISVNPCSQYDLYGLAIELERLELLKETSSFQGMPGLSRLDAMKAKGLAPRFREEWCKNDDPWYDGRSDGYTIVDAPRRLSLLGIDEMIRAVKTFALPEIKSAQSRIIYPFSFQTRKGTTGFSMLCDCLCSSEILEETGFESLNVPDDDFYPHIREYLHLEGLSDSPLKRNCRVFTHREPPGKSGGLDKIILFSYGIGFYITLYPSLITESRTLHPKRRIDELLGYHHNAATQTADPAGFLNRITAGLPIDISVDEGVVYSCIDMQECMISASETGKTLYQVCNLKSYSAAGVTHMQDDIEYSASRKELYNLEINPRIFYGFGKAGGCLVTRSNDNDGEGVGRQKDLFRERFMNTDFVSFLLALHQRTCLISLSRRLSEYARQPRNVAMVRRLRYFIMDFMARGWFSQISRNELNSEIYSRWGRMFENQTLYEEVALQLKSYEDYLNAERNRKIGLISSLFIPATMFDIFYSINLLGKSQHKELISDIPWYGALAILALLFLLMLGYISHDRPRKKL